MKRPKIAPTRLEFIGDLVVAPAFAVVMEEAVTGLHIHKLLIRRRDAASEELAIP